MRFIVMDERTGKLVQPSDTVTDFRGETASFVSADRAREPGRTGKVTVQRGERTQWLYDTVFSLAVVNPDQLLPCGCPAPVVVDQGHQSGCKYNP